MSETAHKILADISEELTDRLHEKGTLSMTEAMSLVDEKLGTGYTKKSYDDYIVEKFYDEEARKKAEWLSNDIMRRASNHGLAMPMYLPPIAVIGADRIKPKSIRKANVLTAVANAFTKYKDAVRSIGQFRPIDIQKGGWKCRRRTQLGSILARGAETKQSIL